MCSQIVICFKCRTLNSLAALEQQFAKLKVTKITRPKFTYVVVGKRHHFRFFPRSPGDKDRSGNMISGFVVDNGKFC